jgi:quaternary ammonium compound-resistance protein SugE
MTTIAWALLLVAGLLEIVWATALKQSDGFTRLWPSIIGTGLSLVSFALLALALRHLPVGTAYAVWVGIGAAGVTIAGIVLYSETASTPRLACLALILTGVIGLRLLETP